MTYTNNAKDGTWRFSLDAVFCGRVEWVARLRPLGFAVAFLFNLG